MIDDLNSTDTDKPLSANQGKVLNDKVTTVETKDSDFTFNEGISGTMYIKNVVNRYLLHILLNCLVDIQRKQI